MLGFLAIHADQGNPIRYRRKAKRQLFLTKSDKRHHNHLEVDYLYLKRH
ncbi:unnamed protein product [Acidithrix sp. C25]|nr:unnamed protein product [Acidithrix sp. C25]